MWSSTAPAQDDAPASASPPRPRRARRRRDHADRPRAGRVHDPARAADGRPPGARARHLHRLLGDLHRPRACPTDGLLVTCDLSEDWTEIARRYWRRGRRRRPDRPAARPGARDAARAPRDEPFDFAFIDADKTEYPDYYEECLRLLRPGGLVMLDNVFRGGEVLDADRRGLRATSRTREVNERVAADERVDVAMLGGRRRDHPGAEAVSVDRRPRQIELQRRGLDRLRPAARRRRRSARPLFERDGVIASVVPSVPDRSVSTRSSTATRTRSSAALDDLALAYEAAGVRAWTVWVPEDDRERRRAPGGGRAPARRHADRDGRSTSSGSAEPDARRARLGRRGERSRT